LVVFGQPYVDGRVRLRIHGVKGLLQHRSQFRNLRYLPREAPVEAENEHKRIHDPSAHRLPEARQHSRQFVLLFKPKEGAHTRTKSGSFVLVAESLGSLEFRDCAIRGTACREGNGPCCQELCELTTGTHMRPLDVSDMRRVCSVAHQQVELAPIRPFAPLQVRVAIARCDPRNLF
jgi:hypothetical protein